MSKLPIAATTLGILTALPLQSWALARIAGGDLTLNAGVSFGYDSNISTNSSEIDDYTATYRASLDYRNEARYVIWGAGIGINGSEFFDESEYSSFDYSLSLFLSPTDEIGGRRFKVDGSLRLDRETDADPDLGQRVTKYVYGANAGITYQANRKYSVGLAGFYTRTDPDEDDNSLLEQTDYGLDLTTYYHYSEKLDYSLTGGVSWMEGSGSPVVSDIDSKTYKLSLGVSGRISPKLTGSVSAGYQWREYDQSSASDASPTVSADVVWAIDDVSSASIFASHEFGAVSSNFNSESTEVGVNYSRTLNRRWSAGAGLRLRFTDFTTSTTNDVRSTDLWEANASVSYIINKWASASLGYIYTTQDSEDAFFDFDRQQVIFSVSASW